MKNSNSNLFSFSALMWLKAPIVAILAAILPIIVATVNAGSLTFNWHSIILTAVSAALGYIMTHFVSNNQGQPFVKDVQPPPLK